MTQFEENILMLTKSFSHFKGKTVSWMNKNVDWLKMYSEYGIDLWASQAERKGYLRCDENKSGELIYFATAKGVREYNKQIGNL